ncbi:hypothetical protein SG000_24815, partial [Klebsiella pneumoniae]|nr:hypothetical protein [Klebsiella pneumoniae]
YCLKTQPATGKTYPKSDLFNKAVKGELRWHAFIRFYHVEALSQIDAIQLLVDASDQVMSIIEKPCITGNGNNAKKNAYSVDLCHSLSFWL